MRLAPQNEIRLGMAIACVARWKQEKNIRLHVLASNPMVGAAALSNLHNFEIVQPLRDYHWTTRLYADEHAQSEPYVLVDDDRIPMHEDWLSKALSYWAFFNKHKQFVMLVDVSMLKCERYCDTVPEIYESSVPCVRNPCWAGPNYLAYKGSIPYREFSGLPNRQDLVIEEWARKNHQEQAVMKDVVSNHMGVGFSQAEPRMWGRY
jgi:hypothetical protein